MGFRNPLGIATQRQPPRRGAVAPNGGVFADILDGSGYGPIELDKNFIDRPGISGGGDSSDESHVPSLIANVMTSCRRVAGHYTAAKRRTGTAVQRAAVRRGSAQ
jgi:hypothetical protein